MPTGPPPVRGLMKRFMDAARVFVDRDRPVIRARITPPTGVPTLGTRRGTYTGYTHCTLGTRVHAGVQSPDTVGAVRGCSGYTGECRMASVAVATPTLPVPYQHLIIYIVIASHTNNTADWALAIPTLGHDPPRMSPHHFIKTSDVILTKIADRYRPIPNVTKIG